MYKFLTIWPFHSHNDLMLEVSILYVYILHNSAFQFPQWLYAQIWSSSHSSWTFLVFSHFHCLSKALLYACILYEPNFEFPHCLSQLTSFFFIFKIFWVGQFCMYEFFATWLLKTSTMKPNLKLWSWSCMYKQILYNLTFQSFTMNPKLKLWSCTYKQNLYDPTF